MVGDKSWPRARLGEFANVQGGFAYPSKEFCDDGVPVLKIKNVRFRDVDTTEVACVSQSLADETTRYYVQHGDILISLTGSGPNQPNSMVGRVARFNGASESFLLNQRIGRFVITKPMELESQYLYYVLTDQAYQIELVHSATGSANQANISSSQIGRLEIPLPPIPEQKAIAHILGVLDDKIELNRRMNATLEGLARALFKSWFVDFDPVRAKMDGRPPEGMDAETAALFPDSFEHQNGSLIPTGWTIKKVGDCITRHTVGKKYNQKTVSISGNVPVLDQGKSGIIGFHDNEPGVQASVEEPLAVFANHTCYMRLITFPFSAIQNVLPFTGKGIDTVWAYYATFGLQSFIEYKGHWPDFVINEIVVPTPDLASEFRRVVQPVIEKLRQIERESESLAALRDTLLPRLLSGELRVGDAEKISMEVL